MRITQSPWHTRPQAGPGTYQFDRPQRRLTVIARAFLTAAAWGLLFVLLTVAVLFLWLYTAGVATP